MLLFIHFYLFFTKINKDSISGTDSAKTITQNNENKMILSGLSPEFLFKLREGGGLITFLIAGNATSQSIFHRRTLKLELKTHLELIQASQLQLNSAYHDKNITIEEKNNIEYLKQHLENAYNNFYKFSKDNEEFIKTEDALSAYRTFINNEKNKLNNSRSELEEI